MQQIFFVAIFTILFLTIAQAKNCDTLYTIEDCGACYDDFDCNLNGECLGVEFVDNVTLPGACLCDAQHAGELCKHNRTNQILALLMAFFFSWIGVARFILDYTALGAVQVVLTVLGICTCGITSIAVSIWGIVDTILIGVGHLKDADGYYLDGWTLEEKTITVLVRGVEYFAAK